MFASGLAALALTSVSFPASAATTRTAKAVVENKTKSDIAYVVLVHKYSDDFFNDETWVNLKKGKTTKGPLTVKYRTGFGTTGKDWWRVFFQFKDGKTCYSDPKNFRGVFDASERLILKNAGELGNALGISIGSGTGVIAGPPGIAAGGYYGGVGGRKAADGLAKLLFSKGSTTGFKQMILRASDENGTVRIIIQDGERIILRAPRSGGATTRYSCFAKPLVSVGQNIRQVIFKGGSFVDLGQGRWAELGADGSTRFRFTEEARNSTSILLVDKSRGYRIKIDLNKNEASVQDMKGKVLTTYDITDKK